MRTRVVAAAFALGLAVFADSLLISPIAAVAIPPKVIGPVLSRKAFYERLAQVKEGMNESQVTALLGQPDYVGHFDSLKRPAVWFYGCTGSRQLATLATIYCDDSGRPVLPLIRAGSPPPANVISEPELREAMLLLDQMPSYREANPGTEIRVANGLLPFGKTKILAVIKEYQRVVNPDVRPDLTTEWKQPVTRMGTMREAFYRASTYGFDGFDGLTLLLRFLFDIPSNAAAQPGQTLPIPIPLQGWYKLSPPFDHTISPRFPGSLFDDVPLITAVVEYSGGVAETATDELPYFEKYGRLRTTPLQPTDRPDKILSDFESSPLWLVNQPYRWDVGYENPRGKPVFNRPDIGVTQSAERAVKAQILRLVAPLYPKVAKFDRNSVRINGASVEIDLSQWDAVMADLKIHPVRWNPNTEEYERRDTASQERPFLPSSKSGIQNNAKSRIVLRDSLRRNDD